MAADPELTAFLAEFRERLSRIEAHLRPIPTVMSFRDAARKLGVGLTKLREMEEHGEIRSSMLGRRKMISLSEIERVSLPKQQQAKSERAARERAWTPIKLKR